MKLTSLIAATFLSTSAMASQMCDGKNCQPIAPFQPTEEQMSFASKIFDIGEPGFDFEMYGNAQKTILVEGVPFAQYWQLEDAQKYVFHPMVFGRYVFNSAVDKDFHKNWEEIVSKVGVELPNGGLAFYYPNHYPLNRMRGPDLIYSAISQSEILAGFIRLHQELNSEKTAEVLSKVRDALFFPHEQGGVDLGVAQLELPLFRSNPEIILNGWLHSLLHLNDYATLMDDMQVASYVERNLEFFVDNHDAWYDQARFITRYSDTSPHRLIVTPEKPGQEFTALFKAKDARLRSYEIQPVLDFENRYSGYDVRINAVNADNGKITMSLTCSSLFDTYLTSDDPFSVLIRDGGYSPFRASPDASGNWQKIESSNVGGREVAHISLKDKELICGYPTNFSKANGRNFYHMQHIIALRYLAEASAYENDELNSRISEIAISWYANNDKFQGKGLKFEDPQAVLDSINRGKTLKQFTDVSRLLF
ncbi:hypothetical protein [Nitratireductor rhodophyticola]|uniref:hypothetical protein n=1 Tax=Nitratireductor rhodophyticola TaxID=2854036 RepID=UPI003009B7A7